MFINKNKLNICLLFSIIKNFSSAAINESIDVEKIEESSFINKENKIKAIEKIDPTTIIKSEISGILPTDDDFKEMPDENISQVINIAPGYNPRTFIFESPNLTVELDGKIRIEGSYGYNTRLLNNCNGSLDKFFVPGKSTIDLGIGVEYGKEFFDRNIINFGIDLRNRNTWGKPDTVASTTITSLKEGVYNYGAHKHDIGVPILYVRGFDLTLDLNALSGQPICTNALHHLKLGLFPFEIGRGIVLGAAYATTPDFLTYEPGDVIQEFAPGILLEGSFDLKKYYHYKSYLGILKNQMSSFNDVNAKTKTSLYGMKYRPQRDFGIINIVWANQFDLTILDRKKSKCTISPYVLIVHEGEEKVVITGDSEANLITLGLAINGGCNDFSFGFEFAKNMGQQNVYGIDTNSISFDNRVYSQISSVDINNKAIENNPNTITNALTNSAVIFIGNNDTTDLKDKNAIYLGESNPRQIAINNVYASKENNGQIINYQEDGIYIMKNSATRFRDPYTNILNGFMAVIDLSYNAIIGNKNIKFSMEGGFASGDENPNASLKKDGDCIIDKKIHNGFIGLQEIYTGKAIRSVFMMSGVGKAPRILSFPALTDENTNNPIGYPTKINRFTNLAYYGGSVNFFVESCEYTYKINPNIILFWQPSAPIIYNTKIEKELGKSYVSSFLGTELNLFLEILPKKIENLKFYLVATLFFPGYYYSDLANIPLDKEQATYINALAKGDNAVFVPLMGNSPAFYINIGLEFKF